MVRKRQDQTRVTPRHGIGEWYGHSFVQMTPAERRRFAEEEREHGPGRHCTWKTRSGITFTCNKRGGVCSLRPYQEDRSTGVVSAASGYLCATCPERFYEDGVVFKWIGETLLKHSEPIVLNEIGFLEREPSNGGKAGDAKTDVGKIDHVLVHPQPGPLAWCALEMQAVYFSGAKMSRDFGYIRTFAGDGIPFPAGHRRPDFRSSGPKRLMPQLQIKVPALRRWGKKMAVVVDRAFFDSLSPMVSAADISNSEIVWFVVKFDESGGEFQLCPDFVKLTTLEHAVEGLTAGKPVSLETFEARIRAKLER